MKGRLNLNRVLTIIVVIIIVLLGSFRDSILVSISEYFASVLNNDSDNMLKSFIDSYGSTKSISQWTAHYLVFYPIYLSCHFILVNILYKDSPKARYWLNISLITILSILILGKIIFGLLNVSLLEEYFSFAFHKLIALPFLLLVIEGGRQLYKLVDEAAH